MTKFLFSFLMLAASTIAVAEPQFAAGGVVGGKLYVVDPNAPIEITFAPSYAGHSHFLSLATSDSFGVPDSWLSIFLPGRAVGTTVTIYTPSGTNTYAAGEELVFKLFNLNTGYSYITGDASSNIDNFAHASVVYNYVNGKALVGFEDLYGGGDKDYNDFQFLVSNVSVTPVPEPETYAMLVAGLGMLLLARRRRI